MANEMKDESDPNLNTPGFEPGTQWYEVLEVFYRSTNRTVIKYSLKMF